MGKRSRMRPRENHRRCRTGARNRRQQALVERRCRPVGRRRKVASLAMTASRKRRETIANERF
jgi:hypothetical protein